MSEYLSCAINTVGQQRLTTTIVFIQAITEQLTKKDTLNYATSYKPGVK